MAPKASQPEAMSALGRLVKAAMDERRWSTRDVEAAGGPPASTTGRIINPRVTMKRPPSEETLNALGRVLQIPEQRLHQAVAELMNWDLTDPMQHEPIRVVAAAMSRLDERQQQAVARIVVSLADELNLADFPKADPQDLAELQTLRNAWVHGQDAGAAAVATKAMQLLEQLLGKAIAPEPKTRGTPDLVLVGKGELTVPDEQVQPTKRAARRGIPAKVRQQREDEDQ